MRSGELVTTDGIFALDGGEWEVTNNIWLVGDDTNVVVIDAAHDHLAIVEAVGGRDVAAIACTHGHNDHINAAVALSDAVDAPVWLHPADRMLWDVVHPDREPDLDLADGEVLVAVVTDGCGSGTQSEVGAQLGARLVAESIRAASHSRRGIQWPLVERRILSHVDLMVQAMGGDYL